MDKKEKLVIALLSNWKREIEASKTYRLLSERDPDKHRKRILLQLAAIEEQHAVKWAGRLKELGAQIPDPSTIEADLPLYLRLSDLEVVFSKLESVEDAHIQEYEKQIEELGDQESMVIGRELIKDEKSHIRTLHAMSGTNVNPRRALDSILHRERWHVRSGNWIGDAIYGINDGLGAVFGIVSGVSGATSGNANYVLISGLAGMLASALSMGSGAYLATKSQREVYDAEMQREKKEINESPDEEKIEMELFYQLKGFTEEESKKLVARLEESPDQFLKLMAHEELGLSEGQFPNPWTSALSASISTALGAFIPIIPFFFLTGYPAIIASLIVSTLAHFAVGAAKCLVTIRPWWATGLEMTIVGLLEAVVTYGLGVLFRVSI